MIQTLRNEAKKRGATSLKKSTRKGKKWMVEYKGKLIHFGAEGMSDYTIHKDKARRKRYRARHGVIKTKDGKLAYKDKTRPAYWSYYLLW
jgi:hypothetical protein